jgi:hypothetical protein
LRHTPHDGIRATVQISRCGDFWSALVPLRPPAAWPDPTFR